MADPLKITLGRKQEVPIGDSFELLSMGVGVAPGATGMIFSGDLTPSVDSTIQLGNDLLKWSRVRAQKITTGDLEMVSNDAHWTLIEQRRRIIAVNNRTSRRYAIKMRPKPDKSST